MLLAPAAILLLALVVYPLVRLLVISFQDYGLRAIFTGQAGFAGFTNYTNVLTDASFWPVILRTVLVTGAMVVGTIGIGMAVSQLLTRLGVVMRTVVSVVLVLAWAMPNVASSLVWQWLFQPFYGVLNWIITQLGVFGDHTQDNWASTPGQSLAIVLSLVIWQAVPFVASRCTPRSRRSRRSTTKQVPSTGLGVGDVPGDHAPALVPTCSSSRSSR